MNPDFEKNGFLYLNELITEQECNEALMCLFIEKENGRHVKDAMGFELSFDKNQLFHLLDRVQPTIETIVGKELLPVYVYSRIYTRGDKLLMHTDRNACEISITLTLGYGGNSLWPFQFLSKDDTKPYISFKDDGSRYGGEEIDNYDTNLLKSVAIQPGDGLLYKGMEVAHGRDVFNDGDWQAQVFLHYVSADGPNVQYMYSN